jgi:uncharacterized membrane protein
MNKGIATQTILLILIGIIVVGILVYVIYRTVLNPSIPAEECRARYISACTQCKNMGFTTHFPIPEELYDTTKCAKGIFAVWSNNYNCDEGNTITDCKALGVE